MFSDSQKSSADGLDRLATLDTRTDATSSPNEYALSDQEKGRDDPNAPNSSVLSGSGGKDFRTMTRWNTLFALVTNQLGLGVLSLPSTFQTIGLIPGIIAMIFFATIT